MENAADALRMVAGVIIFALSLAICVNAFGEVRKTSQIILESQDREYNQKYVKALNLDTEGRAVTERTVGFESIIPTIYKAYKENYKIVFTQEALGNGNYLYTKNEVPIYRIDLEKDILGSDTDKDEFLKALLNGENKEASKFTNRGIKFHNTTLYDMIKGKTFKEYLGVYYQEEIQGETGTPDVNRTPKRVITYDEV